MSTDYGNRITLTRSDMYNAKDECILPRGCFKRLENRSKYSPAVEDAKHRVKRYKEIVKGG